MYDAFVSYSKLSSQSIWILLIGFFYAMAVLEVDPGDLGDDFGDVYDTHLSVTSEKSLKVVPAFFPAPAASDQPASLVRHLPIVQVPVVFTIYQQYLVPCPAYSSSPCGLAYIAQIRRRILILKQALMRRLRYRFPSSEPQVTSTSHGVVWYGYTCDNVYTYSFVLAK
ncbi:hypothetical protein [Spirosoma lacussanchae]|uniref:hypothetical protein n=1 Tax=Spirosoma lacussanchae TaxID=1884249 RepID=UPI001107DD71|nr:hypothetical protein [Spirosoma lacussanchae]